MSVVGGRRPDYPEGETVAIAVETAPFRDHLLPLARGRRLGVREQGDPGGYAVLYFHGVPGVRQALVGRPEDYASAGVRLLTFDRPGYGASSGDATAPVAAWADDMAACADALGLEHFAVVGESGGGPYALACAHRPPRGLEAVVVSSGLAPIDGPDTLAGMKRLNQLALHAFRHRRMAAPVLAGLGVAFAFWPDFVLDHLLCRDSPAADAVLLQEPRIRADAKSMLAATMAGGLGGVIDDIDRLAAPWGFGASDVRLPVHFWHGDADNTAPLQQLLRLAAQIAGSTVTVCPGEGHMVMERHLEEILDFLVGRRARAGL